MSTAATQGPVENDEYDPNVPIEALDPDEISNYGDSLNSSSTQSVTSSVRDYVYDNGRRYHRYGGEGKYLLPNDETEQDRLDLLHHLMLQLLGGRLYIAPIPEKVNRVLDCGTGTGIWALDFAETHPEAQVWGVDLSPIQPSWVYPNVKFEVDNLDKDWTWKTDFFDFIHARHIVEGISDRDRLFEQMYKHLTPGGYVEIAEAQHDLQCDDDSYNPETALWKYTQAYKASMVKAGFNLEDIQDQLVASMEKAGFQDVQVHQRAVPWGPWPKDSKLRKLGATMAACCETGIEAYGLGVMTKFGGYKVDEAKAMIAAAMKDIMGCKVRTYNLQYQVVGRKPMVA